jgi:uncharacterized protein (UPF0276 family)
MGAVMPLGHGIGLRTQHYPHLLEHGPGGVPWFEAISENFFEPGGRPWFVLERVRSAAEVVLHGVSLGVGGTDPPSSAYLAQLRGVIERIEPAWVSDHLCWTSFGGRHTHDLLPLPYTEESLAHVVERVKRVQEALGRRILLENVSSYVTFSESTIPEWEFLDAVAKQTGAGILLDVNNVVVSAKNHGFDAVRFVDAITPEHVAQIHLAGHTDKGDWLLDSHVGPVPSSVWALYRRAVRRFGRIPSLVEWDADVPAFEVVVQEAARAAAIERAELGA